MDKKKRLVVFAALAMVIACGAWALRTKMWGYGTLVISAAGAETDLVAATGYTVTLPAPGGNLNPLDLRRYGRVETSANAVEILAFATCNDNDTCTLSLYGIADGNTGPPEKIASLVYIFGQAIKETGVRWAHNCVASDAHITAVDVSNNGTDEVVKVAFDATGYRYLYAIIHTTTTGAATSITLILRPIG